MWTVCQSLSFAVIHLYPHINLIHNLRNPSDRTRSRTLIFWISKGSHPFRWRECIAMSTIFSISYFLFIFPWWQIPLICSLSVVTIALENRILEWTWTRFRINLNRLQKSQCCKTESKRPRDTKNSKTRSNVSPKWSPRFGLYPLLVWPRLCCGLHLQYVSGPDVDKKRQSLLLAWQ